MVPRIKICCISSLAEARTAIEAAASALGLVGQMPGGSGVITDDMILKIAGRVPPPIGTFLLTSETSVNEIVKHHQRTLTILFSLLIHFTKEPATSFEMPCLGLNWYR